MEAGICADFHAIRPRGFEVRGITSSSDRVAGFTVVADSLEEFNRKHRTVVESVKVLGMDGTDIMRHDLLPDLQ